MGALSMPKLSDTMEEGTVLAWLVADGAVVTRGQPLVEIETDKADMTVESPESGTLHIIAAPGAVLPVGAPIGHIGDDAPAASAPAPPTGDADATNIPVGDDGTPAEIGQPRATTAPAPQPAPAEAPSPLPAAPTGDRVIASPLARKIAADEGIDLSGVRGTGPGGRIVRADVDALAHATPTPAGQPSPAGSDAPPSPRAAAPAPGTRVPATRLQRTIARRMRESATSAPHFALQRDVEVTELNALRRQMAGLRPDVRPPTLNDLVVRAVALAASERPDALAQWDEDAFRIPDGVHIGVAVATERGLLVPVIRDADQRPLEEIAVRTRDLVARCRSGEITAAELEGSTITVSNLGMFGIDRFTAVINPPEAAILAVGAARAQAVVRDGDVVARDMMTLTLSVDHRSLYGAEAATFLGRICALLEMPYGLVAAR